MPRTFVRRAGERVRREERRQKVYVPWWKNPFWFIVGASEPELMVMAELTRRGIYFEHVPQTNPLPWADWQLKEGTRNWEPDILVPQYRIWIEVQGSYFHTLPGAVEQDALRFAYIESVGWRPIFWWEEDIRYRLQDLMNSVPEFYQVDRAFEASVMARSRRTDGLPFYEGGEGVDHLAGLRAALRNRTRPPQLGGQRYRRAHGGRGRVPK